MKYEEKDNFKEEGKKQERAKTKLEHTIMDLKIEMREIEEDKKETLQHSDKLWKILKLGLLTKMKIINVKLWMINNNLALS